MKFSIRNFFILICLPVIFLSFIPLIYSAVLQRNLENSAKGTLTRLFDDEDIVNVVYLKKNNQVILVKQKTTTPKPKQNYATWLKTPSQKSSAGPSAAVSVLDKNVSQIKAKNEEQKRER